MPLPCPAKQAKSLLRTQQLWRRRRLQPRLQQKRCTQLPRMKSARLLRRRWQTREPWLQPSRRMCRPPFMSGRRGRATTTAMAVTAAMRVIASTAATAVMVALAATVATEALATDMEVAARASLLEVVRAVVRAAAAAAVAARRAVLVRQEQVQAAPRPLAPPQSLLRRPIRWRCLPSSTLPWLGSRSYSLTRQPDTLQSLQLRLPRRLQLAAAPQASTWARSASEALRLPRRLQMQAQQLPRQQQLPARHLPPLLAEAAAAVGAGASELSGVHCFDSSVLDADLAAPCMMEAQPLLRFACWSGEV